MSTRPPVETQTTHTVLALRDEARHDVLLQAAAALRTIGETRRSVAWTEAANYVEDMAAEYQRPS